MKNIKNSIARILSLVIALIGVWYVLSPWVLGYGGVTSAMVSSEVIGGIFIVFGVVAGLSSSGALTSILNWLNAFVSFWMIWAPFILNYFAHSTAAEVNTIIVGVVVLILAIWAALAAAISANRASQERQNQGRHMAGAIPVTGSGNGDADYKLLNAIQDRLNQDKRVNAKDVKVFVQNGQVTLKGNVTTDEEKEAAKEDAQKVSGVKSVNDDLRAAV